MRSLSALFLLAIVTGSWAVQFTESIPNIRRADGPKMLLSEIAAKIAAEGPLDDIFKMFDKLERQIRNEQVEHDTLYAKQQKECKSELEFRAKEIADATSAIGRATQEKNACATNLHQAFQSLKSNLKTQKDLQSDLDIKTATRKAEKAVYDARHRNFVAAIAAVDGGHQILKQLYNGAATLIDLSKVTTTMFHHGVANGNAHHYVPLIGALAQLSMNADLLIDQNILARVEDLFTVLRKKLADELKLEETTESKSIAAYEIIKTDLSAQIKKAKDQEKVLRDQITTNQQCIVKANNIITQATTKKERNTNLQNDAKKMCTNFEQEYKTASSQRKEELSLVDKLRELTGAKLKFSKNVNKRATQNKGQFAKYKNVAKLGKGRRGLSGGKKAAPAAAAAKKGKFVEVAEDDTDEPVDAAVDSVNDDAQ